MPSIRLVTLAVGTPQPLVDAHGRAWTSAVAKRPVDRPVRLTRDGFEGDRSRWAGHHRPTMKVHFFPAEHYPAVEARYGRPLPHPAFGENLMLDGYTEAVARVGDVLRVGTALIRVTMPNERCSSIGRFLHEPRMLKWLNAGRTTGGYAEVLEEGVVGPDSDVTVEDRGACDAGGAAWTLERLNHALLVTPDDPDLAARIDAIPGLAGEWRAIHARHHARALRRGGRLA